MSPWEISTTCTDSLFWHMHRSHISRDYADNWMWRYIVVICYLFPVLYETGNIRRFIKMKRKYNKMKNRFRLHCSLITEWGLHPNIVSRPCVVDWSNHWMFIHRIGILHFQPGIGVIWMARCIIGVSDDNTCPNPNRVSSDKLIRV